MGNGLVMPSLLTLALRSVPTHFAGAAAGVYSTFQQTASALGVSIIGGLFYFVAGVHRYDQLPDYRKAFDLGLAAEIFCLVLAGLCLYFLPEKKERPPVQEAFE